MEKIFAHCVQCGIEIYDGEWAYHDGERILCEACLDRYTNFQNRDDDFEMDEADHQWSASKEERHGIAV